MGQQSLLQNRLAATASPPRDELRDVSVWLSHLSRITSVSLVCARLDEVWARVFVRVPMRLLTGCADALLLLLFIQVIKDPPPPPPPSRPPPPVSHNCFIFRFENPCGAKEENGSQRRFQSSEWRSTEISGKLCTFWESGLLSVSLRISQGRYRCIGHLTRANSARLKP